MVFRRQVTNQCSLDWGVIDLALYKEAFMGQAQLILRCHFCLADSHDTRERTLDQRKGTYQRGLHNLLPTRLYGSRSLCKSANCLTNQGAMLGDTGSAVTPTCALIVIVALIQQRSAQVAMDVHRPQRRVGLEERCTQPEWDCLHSFG